MKRGKTRFALWMALLLTVLWTAAAQAEGEASAAAGQQTTTVAGQTAAGQQTTTVADGQTAAAGQQTSGVIKTGWQKINGKKYYVEADGTHKTGWFTYKKKKYYLNPGNNGAMVTGVKKIGKKYYCFDAKGRMLKNKKAYQVGKNYYAIDSKGVARKLSAVEKQAVKQMKKLGTPKLRAAFNWAAKLPYQAISTSGKKPKDFASYGFTYKRGDCNVQACTFYLMAAILGYDAHYVKGTVPQANGTSGKHAWVEIDIKGKTYVFDPNLAGQYASVYGKNTGWKFRYGAKHTYKYQNIKRVN